MSDQDYLQDQARAQVLTQGLIKLPNFHKFNNFYLSDAAMRLNTSIILIHDNTRIQPEVIYLFLRSDLVIMRIPKNRFKYRVDIFSFIC